MWMDDISSTPYRFTLFFRRPYLCSVPVQIYEYFNIPILNNCEHKFIEASLAYVLDECYATVIVVAAVHNLFNILD